MAGDSQGAVLDWEFLTKPLSTEAPCGPDLDLDGDADFLNFLANAESQLPKSYFVTDSQSGEEKLFDFVSSPLKDQIEAMRPLLVRTRDLRLLVMLAKIALLGRDLLGFVTCVRAIGALIRDRWDEVHPRAENGDFGLRLAVIESIEAMPTVVMPLQFVPLVQSRRFGAITYRSYAIATGDVKARECEEALDLSNIDKAIEEADLSALMEKRQQLLDLATGLNAIAKMWHEKSGQALGLGKLMAVADKMVIVINAAVTRRSPDASLAATEPDGAGDDDRAAADQEAPGGTVIPGLRIASPAQAAASLVALGEYFSRAEPSNPARLLICQARELHGKSFLEVMRILLPEQVERASINIGSDRSFGVPIERLSSFAGQSAPPVAGAELNGSGEIQAPAIETRREALAMMDQIIAYYRAAEPSSPVPFLIERARDLSQRDFLGLLKAVLPADALKPSPEG
jgi:type VI secretion system protein ImpA